MGNRTQHHGQCHDHDSLLLMPSLQHGLERVVGQNRGCQRGCPFHGAPGSCPPVSLKKLQLGTLRIVRCLLDAPCRLSGLLEQSRSLQLLHGSLFLFTSGLPSVRTGGETPESQNLTFGFSSPRRFGMSSLHRSSRSARAAA